MSVPTYSESFTNRRNAAEHAATGGALLAAGGTANWAGKRALKRQDRPGLLRATARSASNKFLKDKPHIPNGLSRAHVPYVGSKLLGRGTQVASLPLIAGGVKHLVSGESTRKLSVREDVVKPTLHAGLYQDQVQVGSEHLHDLALARQAQVNKSERSQAREFVRSLPEGRHRVATEKIDPLVAGSGFRLYDRRYVARMARDMDSNRKLRSAPTRFAVHADGRVKQIDGAHRYAARNMRGDKRVPIEVSRVASDAPRSLNPVAPVRTVVQRKLRAHDRGMSRDKLERMASTVPGWVAPVNDKLSAVAKGKQRVARFVGNIAANASHGATSDIPRVVDESARHVDRSVGLAADRLDQSVRRGALVAGASLAGGIGGGLTLGAAGKRAVNRKKPVQKFLSPSESDRLSAHKKIGRGLALTSGTMGLTALGMRAPSGAKVLASRGVKVPGRLVRAEAAATRHSNTLGIGAIGVGSMGSFNYAAQQKLERKKDEMFAKAWMDRNIDRISPKAEDWYKSQRHRRNEGAAAATGNLAIGGLTGWGVTHELKRGVTNKPVVAATAAGGIGAMAAAYSQAKSSHRGAKHMKKVQAAAVRRERDGLWGPGRGKTPVDPTSRNLRHYAAAMTGSQ